MKTKAVLIGLEAQQTENGDLLYLPVFGFDPLALPEVLELFKSMSAAGTVEVNIQ